MQVLENIVTSGVKRVSPQYKATASLGCKSKHLYKDVFVKNFFLIINGLEKTRTLQTAHV